MPGRNSHVKLLPSASNWEVITGILQAWLVEVRSASLEAPAKFFAWHAAESQHSGTHCSSGKLVQVWRKGGGFVPLALYAAQLALNLAWSPIFFKKHQLGFALADITGALVLGVTPPGLLAEWHLSGAKRFAARENSTAAPHSNDCRLRI